MVFEVRGRERVLLRLRGRKAEALSWVATDPRSSGSSSIDFVVLDGASLTGKLFHLFTAAHWCYGECGEDAKRESDAQDIIFFVELLIENEENKEEKMPEELDEMVLKSDRV